MMHKKWAGMLLEVVFLPKDSFTLLDGPLIALVGYVCGAIGGFDSKVFSLYPTFSGPAESRWVNYPFSEALC